MALNRLQTYHVQFESDTVRITATKPVSLFQISNFDVGASIVGHGLTEQIPPTAIWGNFFLVASLERVYGYLGGSFSAIAANNSTAVTVYCTTYSQPLVYHIQSAGSRINFSILAESFCSIESSLPILVVQTLSARFSGHHNTSMMLIIPVEQYSNNYVIYIIARLGYSFIRNLMTIYVNSEYYQPEKIFLEVINFTDPTNSCLILRNSMSSWDWTQVYCNGNEICGYITSINLWRLNPIEGTYIIKFYHQDPGAEVGLSAYGGSGFRTYGYPGGLTARKYDITQF